MSLFKRIATVALVGLSAASAIAQIAPGRTWPELKDAVTERAKAQRYPLNGFDPAEVQQILSRIGSLDRDEWARSWMQSGDRMFQAAQAAEPSDRAKAREHYLAAWRYHSFGAWPTQNSPEKKRAHGRATESFRAYARLAEPQIEVLRIPFEGKEIIGYPQRPAGVARSTSPPHRSCWSTASATRRCLSRICTSCSRPAPHPRKPGSIRRAGISAATGNGRMRASSRR
jgi:hypothetical protein